MPQQLAGGGSIHIAQKRTQGAFKIHRSPFEDAFEPFLDRSADETDEQEEERHPNGDFEGFGIEHVSFGPPIRPYRRHAVAHIPNNAEIGSRRRFDSAEPSSTALRERVTVVLGGGLRRITRIGCTLIGCL